MTKPRMLMGVFALACVGALAVHVVAQQRPPQQQAQLANPPAQPGDEGAMPAPLFGPPPPQTRLEAIASQKGVLLTKGYTDVGEIHADDGSRLRLTAVQFADARQARETGIVVSVEQRGNGNDPVVAYVDADELDGLAEALEALAKMESGASPMANVEGVYRTRGDLEFTNHVSNGGRVVTARATQILLPSGQVATAAATFRPARLSEIRQQIATAKETLNRPAEQAGK